MHHELDPDVYLLAAKRVDCWRIVGCCSQIAIASGELEELHSNYETLFQHIFMPEGVSLYNYWWEPPTNEDYKECDMQARVFALLLAYEIVENGDYDANFLTLS